MHAKSGLAPSSSKTTTANRVLDRPAVPDILDFPAELAARILGKQYTRREHAQRIVF
jgi:hypothetical protein